MRCPSLERIAFTSSLVVLAFLYGIATQAFGWFPSPSLQRAWIQAEAVLPELTGFLKAPEFASPRVYDRAGVRAPEPEASQPGLTLISGYLRRKHGDWEPGIKLIDRHGRVVHRWVIDPQDISKDSDTVPAPPVNVDVHGSFLFPNGDILLNIEYAETIRMDACGAIEWRLSRRTHHSITRSGDGSFWIPGVGGKAQPPNELAGLRDAKFFQDQILRVSPAGKVLTEIDVVDILYWNDLHRYIAKREQQDATDITHLNDIDPLPDSLAGEYPLFDAGDLAVSLRNLHLVFVVDPDTWNVKWHTSDPFIEQHDPDWLGDGWIGVFNNNVDGTSRGTMLGGSQVITIQPHTDSIKVRFPTETSERLYTSHKGEWQKLRNDNYLLTESAAGRVVEVDSTGHTVWEWVEPRYEGTYVPEISKARRVDLSREDVWSWPCASNNSTSSTQALGYKIKH